MASYVEITAAEMAGFMQAEGFTDLREVLAAVEETLAGTPNNPSAVETTLQELRHTLASTKEAVYSRTNAPGISLRVYTSIVEDSAARSVGKDAIRVLAFGRSPSGLIRKLGGAKRVHRVENWRGNLRDRIAEVASKWQALRHCPQCGDVMAVRETKAKPKRKFWGCSGYPQCKHTAKYEE